MEIHLLHPLRVLLVTKNQVLKVNRIETLRLNPTLKLYKLYLYIKSNKNVEFTQHQMKRR